MGSIYQATLCELCQRPTIAVVKSAKDWVSVCQAHAVSALQSKRAAK